MTVDAKEIDLILENDAVILWAKKVNKTCDVGEKLSEEDIPFTIRHLLVKLSLDNGQRPGLAINMTIKEYDEREFAPDGSAIIYIAKHKTATSGSVCLRITAKVTLDLMDNWRLLIRKVVCDVDNQGTFLVRRNSTSVPSTEAAKEFYAFGSMVHLWIPSPRMSRKLPAAAHMSHFLQTS